MNDTPLVDGTTLLRVIDTRLRLHRSSTPEDGRRYTRSVLLSSRTTGSVRKSTDVGSEFRVVVEILSRPSLVDSMRV